MTLRRTLTLGVLALVALVAVLIGVISTVTLNTVLIDRLDNQLPGAQTRSQTEGRSTDGADALDFLDRQTSGTVGLILIGGVVLASGAVGADGSVTALTSSQATALAQVAPGAPPTTVNLGDLGDYRVTASSLPSGEQVIIGLSMAEAQATVGQQIIAIVIVTVVVLALAALAVGLVIRIWLRPLERVAGTATRVAELPLDRGEVALVERVGERDADTRTEAGRVGAAFNRMLDHITAALTARQQSEDRVRRFVADASHELRTPLASIRGYAELTRRGEYDLPDDVTRSLGRIESEAVRMTSLVEDLLLLARLDSRPEVAADEVDLTRLVVDAVGDAHASGPDKRWVLELPEEPVLVVGDAPRLFQVISNLLTNARVHTPEGTTVTVELSANTADGVAALSVLDDGPGIDPGLHTALFGRFVRGDSSRNRHTGSTGLGLAIVAAVVDAHHGSVSVASEPGRTVFRVTLPLWGGAVGDQGFTTT